MMDFTRLLVCPDSLTSLVEREGGLFSERTGALYRFRDGIPVMYSPVSESGMEPAGEGTADFLLSVMEDEQLLPAVLNDALGKAVREMAETAAAGAGVTLELAAGYGKLARRLMALGPLSLVVMADPSPALLAALRDSLAAEGLTLPWMVSANLRRLPFRTSFADRVLSVAGFNNVRNARLALGEAARVLKDGGRLTFVHLTLPDPDCPGAAAAAEQGMADLLNIADLDLCMRGYDLRPVEIRELASGRWPENDKNLVPASGDPYSLYLVTARKEG